LGAERRLFEHLDDDAPRGQHFTAGMESTEKQVTVIVQTLPQSVSVFQ
jgi:hypothetical protein